MTGASSGAWFFTASSNGDTFSQAIQNDLIIYTDSNSQNILIGSSSNVDMVIDKRSGNITTVLPIIVQSNVTLSSNGISIGSHFTINSVDGGVPGGNLFVTGIVTQISDCNTKSHLQRIEGALDKLVKINGYTYQFEDRTDFTAGLIAQEVQAILPEAVKRVEMPEMPPGTSSKSGTLLTLDYAAMSSLYVESIKELYAIVLDMKKKKGIK